MFTCQIDGFELGARDCRQAIVPVWWRQELRASAGLAAPVSLKRGWAGWLWPAASRWFGCGSATVSGWMRTRAHQAGRMEVQSALALTQTLSARYHVWVQYWPW
ncbi:hypothetical protein P3T39_006940 [Kitasatospora sp. GP82]|nr:hypothetical protein [Kitasatospora sp. GP82]